MPTFNVSTKQQLSNALSDVRSGDTILLEGGEYGDLDLSSVRQSNLRADKTITIASADPGDPAVFNGLSVWNASNLALEGLKFNFRTDASTSAGAMPFRVDGSDNIAIRDSTFTGDSYKGSEADLVGYGAGFGLRVLRSENIILEGSEFSEFRVGTNFSQSQNLTIRNNIYSELSGDALKFAAVAGVLIEGNEIGNFRSNREDNYHQDMIQFFTSGTDVPSSDIVIRGNTLHSGGGEYTQSIFMANEMVSSDRAGREMFYRDILIEDNVIYNAHAHGITVGATDGLTIRNNTILHNPADGDHRQVYIPKINVSDGSVRVSVTDNITDSIIGKSAAWEVSGNLFVQRTDVLGDGYYNDLFVAANRPAAPFEALQALPGSLVERLKVGADMTRFDSTPDSLTALARASQDKNTHFFDAGLSADPSGLLGNKAVYRWDFGDGTTGTGQVISHVYDSPGDHVVVLTATRGGESDTFTFIVQDPDPTLLSLRFGAGGQPDDSSFYDIPAEIVGRATSQENGSFRLTDDNYLSVERDVSTHLHALDEFALSFSLQRDDATSGTGRIMQITSSWIVKMEGDGRLVFEVTNSAGKTFALTSKTAITDRQWHDVTIAYDANDGVASISIDGAASGSIAVSGSTQAYNGHSLLIGNPWGSSFNGKLRAVDIVAESGIGSGGDPVKAPPSVEAPPAPTPTPVPPVEAPSTPVVDADLAEIAAAIASGDLAGLAADTGRALVTGSGSSADEVVIAGSRTATSNGGDDVLVGNARDNWLVGGEGADALHGGAGADDFRFFGRDAASAGADAILDLDFGAGDRIILSNYADGTFSGGGSGLNVFSGGGTAIVSSMDGLERLADASSDVTLDDGPDGLALEVEQGRAVHGILLADVEGGGSGEPVKAPPQSGAPEETPSGPVVDADLAEIAAAIASGDLAGLAADTGRALVTGGGSSADEVVLAGGSGWRTATSNGGDDVLVGNARDNWLVGGKGADVMHGGAGADDFRFFGRDAARRGVRRHPRSRFRGGRPDHSEQLRGRHVLGRRVRAERVLGRRDGDRELDGRARAPGGRLVGRDAGRRPGRAGALHRPDGGASGDPAALIPPSRRAGKLSERPAV